MYIAIALIDIVQMLLWVLSLIIIVQAVLSWLIAFNVINRSSDFVRAVWTALERLTEPVYRPIRRIMPDFGGIDFTPLVAILIIWVLDRLLEGLQQSLFYGV
jgi:YggT family protein